MSRSEKGDTVSLSPKRKEKTPDRGSQRLVSTVAEPGARAVWKEKSLIVAGRREKRLWAIEGFRKE